MSAHTPGPWYVEEQNYDSSSFYIRGSDSKGERLTWGKGAVAHIPRSTVMPMEANARLIAAAPDLLAALCELDGRLRNCCADPIYAGEAYDSFYQAIVADAIAKAQQP